VSPLAPPRPLTSPASAQWAGHAAGKRLIFLHIPKTAGTAVASVLTQWFGVDEIMPCSALCGRPLSDPTASLAARQFRLFGIGKHFDHDHVAALRHALQGEERPFVFTVLREPRARLISQYLHWQRTDDRSLAAVDPVTRAAYLAARELPIGAFLNTRTPFIIEHFRNYQTRFLAGFSASLLMNDEELLGTALDNVAGYDLVGTTSHCDAAIEMVATAYGWPSPGVLQSLNTGSSKAPERFDDATETIIAEYTAVDAAVWQRLHAEPTRASSHTATCYYAVDDGIKATLLENARTRFDMRQPLDGSGWRGREGERSEWRWTGPGRRSTIRLATPRSRRLAVSIQVVCSLDSALIEGMKLSLDGVPPLAAATRQERGGAATIEAEFMLPEADRDRRELVIEVPFTRPFPELKPEWSVDQETALAVGEIVVSACGAASPATLGELFWPGAPWDAESPSRLADLLRVRRDTLPVSIVDRDLAFDLPVLSAILELIQPQHVLPDNLAGPLGSLASGHPDIERGERLAIVGTRFGMSSCGSIVTQFAARHNEVVLLLAMADDLRLRALVKSPLLAPHVHMLGCANGILIANLSGMRRTGGTKLMECFLWLLERIGATTPVLLNMPTNALECLHVGLQLRLTLAAVVAAADDSPEPELRSAILATLLPEDATPPSLAIVQSQLTALRARGDTLLELVDPEFLDSLEQSIAQAETVGKEFHTACPSVLAAHEKAFRLLGMLAGWREWGLKTNTTAALAMQCAAAKNATRLLSNAQRQLATKALRIDMSSDVGMLLPKPLKPWREYCDYHLLEARCIGSKASEGGIVSGFDQPHGESVPGLPFSQMVQTVEEMLRQLGERFPNEEIVWVDAGCASGLLLNAVEPPQNIRSRRCFIGIDSCPTAIAAAREAAAAAGRSHCRFEVGDIIDAGQLTGGAKIHLITSFSVLEQCPDPLAVLKTLRSLHPSCLLVSPARAEPQGVLPSPTDLWTWDAAGFLQMAEEAAFEPIKAIARQSWNAATAAGSSLPLYLTPRASQSHSEARTPSRSEQSSPSTPPPPAPTSVAPPSPAQAPPVTPSSLSPGAPSMIAGTMPHQLTDAEFFSRHYPKLSIWLNTFAHARHQATKAHDKAPALADLIGVSNQIAAEGLSIISGSPALGESESPREFFSLVTRLREALRQSPTAAHVAAGDELDKHLAYFHQHVSDAALDTAIQTEPASIYVRECVSNCIHVLTDRVFNGYQWTCPDPRQVRDFFDTSAAEAEITPAARRLLTAVTALEGWCSPQKSLLLYSLTRSHKPKTVVEIGIYGGRSIVPIAAALKDNGVGQVYGIETWSGSAATSYRTNIANDFWWQNIDFPKLKGDFLQFVVQHQLQDTIRVVEAASDRCAGLFDRIDLLHIDGGHSTYGAAQDVVNYVSKVPSGGIIVYDDINWPSTAAGLDILRDSCRLLHVVTAFGSETEPGCAAFVKV
jgi:predicted O-methyltransferase YrrM